MKVLQLVTTPRAFFDGQVAALERAGVDCTVLPMPGAAHGRTLADYARYYPTVLDAVRSDEFDVVHANNGPVAPFALAQPTRPVVVTFWGTDLMADDTAAHLAVRRASRWAARHADAVVLPSPALEPWLPDRDHALIPFGVDTDRFRPAPRAEARARVGWDEDETVVVFPYDPARRVKDHPRAERVVEAADADATLRAVHGVPHDEFPAYLNAADAVLVTSRRESGPMVVKEAAACGVPVVSTDVGFAAHALDGVPNAAVADADDDLAAALDDVLARGERADADDARPRFDLDATGEALRDVYEAVLDGRPAAPEGVRA